MCLTMVICGPSMVSMTRLSVDPKRRSISAHRSSTGLEPMDGESKICDNVVNERCQQGKHTALPCSMDALLTMNLMRFHSLELFAVRRQTWV